MNFISKMPKIDLHCHLDGCLDVTLIKRILGDVPIEHIMVNDNCSSLAEYLKCFEAPINCLAQREYTQKLTYEFIKSLSLENVKYVEVRFSPLLIASASYSEREIIENVIAGLKQAEKDFEVKSNIIICAMRHLDEETNIKSFKLAKEYENHGVCGLDIAGDENSFPAEEFKGLFSYAKSLEMPFTIHAGECGNARNILESIGMGAKRIGHGVAMRGDIALQKICVDKNIGIELCPTSNFQTKASTIENYPLREFYNNGVKVTINTDNRTVSNTSLTKELSLISDKFKFTDNEIKTIYRNAVEVSFASDDVKDFLLKL